MRYLQLNLYLSNKMQLKENLGILTVNIKPSLGITFESAQKFENLVPKNCLIQFLYK